MPPVDVPLEGVQGDSFGKTLTFEQPPGSPMDLTNYEFVAQVRDFPGQPGTPKASFSITVGLQAHQRRLSLTKDQMSDLVPRIYFWDMQWTDPAGEVKTVFAGTFTVNPQVSVP